MKRSSGVLMHASSLWGLYSEGSFGKEAGDFVDFLADCGFSYWQVLPFCLPDDVNSPYQSFSAFSGNPFFIDLPTLYEKGLLTKEELLSAEQKTPYACEFKRLSEERYPLLAKAADRFAEKEKIAVFLASHPRVGEFCRFMALKKANGEKPWNQWTVDIPDAGTLAMWEFIEYEFYTEWMSLKAYANEKGIRIIGDLPIYVAWDSADVWANPNEFQLDEQYQPKRVAGVPPDYFCKDGQLWNNPLYDWDEMAKNGYRWWRERMAYQCELFDGVRLDHFRGFSSYFSIPAGAPDARGGEWVKGPGKAFADAIREVTGDRLIIAEDLGDIDDDVRELVRYSHFPGMRVLQFGFLSDADNLHLPHNYERNCVAYTGTHDNNTLLGYVWELDEATRKKLLAYCGFEGNEWDKCYPAIERTVMASVADLVILPIQDLLLYGSDTRINQPGRKDGNWSYRVTAEQLGTIDRERFRRFNELYGRKH